MSINDWYKGNLHTHTTESDGDEVPEKVCEWFEDHGYDFLVLSDHNHLTLLDYGESGLSRLILIPGEEISANAKHSSLPIHIGAIGINRVLEPATGEDIVSTLQMNIDSIREAGGISCINHPNFRWAFDHTHMSQVEGANMFEIFNGSRGCNNDGGPGKPSTTKIWDALLSKNKHILGAATDDSHNYHDFHPAKHNPGRGWIMVRSESGEESAIIKAMELGEFYSSSGVELSKLETDQKGIHVKVLQEDDFMYRIRFIGSGGRTLKDNGASEAYYEFQGDEGYVRAEIVDSDGAKAWVQPVFVES